MLKTLVPTALGLMCAYQSTIAQVTTASKNKVSLPQNVIQALDAAYQTDSSQTYFDPKTSYYKLICASEKLNMFGDSSVYGVQYVVSNSHQTATDTLIIGQKITALGKQNKNGERNKTIYETLLLSINDTQQNPSAETITNFKKQGLGNFNPQILSEIGGCEAFFDKKSQERAERQIIYRKAHWVN